MQEFRVDVFDPGFRRDPYRAWARLRDMDRVVRSRSFGPSGRGAGAYVVHRYEDVRRVLGDHESYSSAALFGPAAGDDDAAARQAAAIQALMEDPDVRAMIEDPDVQATLQGGIFGGSTMLTTDRPEHDRLRGVVNKAFLPRRVSELEGSIRELTQDLVRPLAAGGRHELVGTLAGPLPSIVIAELLGIPREDHGQFQTWSNAVISSAGAVADGSVEDPLARFRQFLLDSERLELVGELRRYLTEQIARATADPGDDLISRMVEANRNEQLTADELVASAFLLLVAGNETTTRLIANLAVALHHHPDQRDLLVAEPGLIPSAVEEALRYDPPVQSLSRLSTVETEFGGQVIPARRVVVAVMAAANRDPRHVDEPDRFDVTRPASNLSFGTGIHFCLGAPLARREARIAFEELLAAAPRFTVLDADALEYRPVLGATLRGPERVVLST